MLEADVLASFSAFDANRDGYLTKDEVVAMLTRNTAGGYAMTRAAAEAKWNEWVQRHDANSDGKLSYKEIAAGITHQPRKPAYMEAVKKKVKVIKRIVRKKKKAAPASPGGGRGEGGGEASEQVRVFEFKFDVSD